MLKPAIVAFVLSWMLAAAVQAAPADEYWSKLKSLCGQAFEGTLMGSPDGDMEGERLVMHVRDCNSDQIRIPFVVGDNLSRTWVLARLGGRIMLRHDHRDRDGKPEEITQYGGISPNYGSANAQIFPADDFTLDRMPDNYPNVWVMEVHPGEKFVYYVRRLVTDRHYHVEFDLSQPVEPPPAPWGWRD
jgi:hypothetical protein